MGSLRARVQALEDHNRRRVEEGASKLEAKYQANENIIRITFENPEEMTECKTQLQDALAAKGLSTDLTGRLADYYANDGSPIYAEDCQGGPPPDDKFPVTLLMNPDEAGIWVRSTLMRMWKLSIPRKRANLQ